MKTVNQTLWQTADGKKDLILLNRGTGEMIIKAFSLSLDEAVELEAALAACRARMAAAAPREGDGGAQ